MSDPLDYETPDQGDPCNFWTYDWALQRLLEHRLGADHGHAERLDSFGATVGEIIAPNADVVADNDPELHTYDRDGTRINELEYHPAFLENERLAYESGVIADAFTPPPGEAEPVPFLAHFAHFYLMDYASCVGLGCPAAMTGGAALVLEKFDDGALSEYYEGLTARDIDEHLQGGMFLTEKQGGSDVGANATTATLIEAVEDGPDVYGLEGEKWFCSNLDAGVPLVLARRPEAPEGTAGLSLFLVPRERRDGEPNDYTFRRLKDKLGTRSVPTGEVEFEGAEAYLIGEPERGFKYMSEMLNMERLYNAVSSVGGMGRALHESLLHATDREAFGEALIDHPLMRRDLLEMTVDHEAAMAVAFEAAEQFGAREDARRNGEADDDAYRLMRLLVPVAKYKTARMAVDTTTYAMEIRGGDGYVEDFVHPRLVRNAHVLPIWEGPSNIMALDVLRAIASEGAHATYLQTFRDRLDAIDAPRLAEAVSTVEAGLDTVEETVTAIAALDPADAEYEAKELTDLLFDVTAAVCLLERADHRLETAEDAREALVAETFVRDRFERAGALDRGIGDGEQLSDDAIDAILEFATVEPEQPLEAAD